jgi:hypothetical protein
LAFGHHYIVAIWHRLTVMILCLTICLTIFLTIN